MVTSECPSSLKFSFNAQKGKIYEARYTLNRDYFLPNNSTWQVKIEDVTSTKKELIQNNRHAQKSIVKDFNLPFKPETGNALVYVVRPSTEYYWSFDVYLDDQSDSHKVGFNKPTQ